MLNKPEGRYDFSGFKKELRGADAALEQADAELDSANKPGVRRALMKAVGHFNAAIKLSVQIDLGSDADGILAWVYFCRGRAFALLNKIESGSDNIKNAIADFVKSAEMRPDAKTYLRLGEAYALAGDMDAAIESLEKASSLDFDCAEADLLRTLKGLVRQEKGDAEDACGDAEEPIVF